jgi:DNA-binding beta-propeller fold protein YncE
MNSVTNHNRITALGGVAVAVTLASATAWAAAIPAGAVSKPTALSLIGSPGTAGLYAWGAATMPDGSILLGDYWNYRIVHYEESGAPASPLVFTGKQGFGGSTNQAPFGICVDTTNGPDAGDVYMTEGSEYNVNQYSKTGVFITSWGTTNAVHSVNFDYPSQCAVNPVNGKLYISNQWGKSMVILDPANPTAPAQFISPAAPNNFIQPRGLAFDSSGNLWIADQGHHRIEIWPNGLTGTKPLKTINPPGGVGSTFDMRGLAIDTKSNLAFVANGQNCLVQEFNANPSSPSYGQFVTNFNGVGSTGSDCGSGPGQFGDGARDLAVAGNGDVWVADLADFRAEVFNESGTYLFSVPNPPAPPPNGSFNGPRGVAFDSAGDLFVTDTYNERIEEFTKGSGGYVFSKAWGIRGTTASTFNYPRLMCYDKVNGFLIVANTDGNEIVAWSTAGKEQWFVGGMATPYGVACGANGTIYVANGNGGNIVVVSSAGAMTGTIGSGLGFVRGIWVDTDGSIWASNMTTGAIDHFSATGTKLAGFSTGSDTAPFGIAGDAGYLYVALSSSNEVGQYTRAGKLVQTFGGAGKALGQLRTPQGLAFGPDGNLYVVEENNNRLSVWSVP